MPYISHSFPFEDSLARNNDVYEVEFSNWGFRDVAPAPNVPDVNLQYPPPGARPIPSSCAVVAIGPRSTANRCWISWDRAKTLQVPAADNPNPQAVISLPRIITLDAPLLYPTTTRDKPSLGPAQSWWDAMQLGIAYVFPFGPKPGAQNALVDGVGNVAKGGEFGQTTTCFPNITPFVNMFGVSGPFTPLEEPFLHLLLYPKLPSFAPPLKRAIMLRERTWQLGAGAGGYFIFNPIYGRRFIRISAISHNFTGSPSQIVDYRVGLIRNVNENPVGANTPIFEVKAAEALGVAAETPVNFVIDNPCADYVTVHITNGNVGPASGAVTLAAED